MPNQNKESSRVPSNSLPEAAPQRPRTLLQRLSSGLSSIVPPIALRRAISTRTLTPRPGTAPIVYQDFSSGKAGGHAQPAKKQPAFLPNLGIPILSDPQQPCPYDSNRYHTFPSIEKPTCDFCGLRSASKWTGREIQNRPCSACRSRSPWSHIKFSRRPSGNGSGKNAVVPSRPLHEAHSASSLEEAPRPVPAAVAARRIGNPPRRASLPVPRLVAQGPLQPTAASSLNLRQPLVRESFSVSTTLTRSQTRTVGSTQGRPISPRLHHLHVLPGANEYPYVHKNEVEQHLAALRLDAPSPLSQSSQTDSPRASTTIANYSETVFYGHTFSPAPDRSSAAHQSHNGPQFQAATMVQPDRTSDTSIITNVESQTQPANHEMELSASELYRRRSPEHQSRPPQLPSAAPETPQSEVTFERSNTGSTQTVGGRRLELKGGSQPGSPRLRGGYDNDCTPRETCAFRFKRWLLTGRCGNYHSGDTDSDADLPPPRVVSSNRVAQCVENANRRAPLPATISRDGVAGRQNRVCASTATHNVATVRPGAIAPTPAIATRYHKSLLPHCPNLQRLCFLCKHPASPIHKPRDTTPLPLIQPIPSLTGGAGSPSCLQDTDRLPPTLFWLAGGRGKPITVSSWKKQRQKKRMGGLLGMAVFGRKAGTEYSSEKSNTAEVLVQSGSSTTAVEVDVSCGKSDLRSVTSGSSRSSSTPSSKNSSNAESTRGAPNAPIAQREDAEREAAEEATPEAPAPVEEVVQDGAAAEAAQQHAQAEPENVAANAGAEAVHQGNREHDVEEARDQQ